MLRQAARPSLPLAALLLAGAALALYWSGLGYPRVFDDHHLSPYALRTYYADALTRFGHLRWLSDASFGAVYALLGGKLLWQRLVNVLLHAATAALLFGFLARLFDAVLKDAGSRWLAFFGALWFAVNPVAVYGAGYLMERSIVLATAFSLAALWCFLEGVLRGAWRWYVAAGLGYFLAVSSKEHAVMVPAVALALAVLVRGMSRRLAGVFIALLLLGAVVVAQRWNLIGAAYEPFAADFGVERAIAYPLSIENQATLFFRYLATWLVPWPAWMSIDLRTAFPHSLLAWPDTAGFLAWLAYGAAAAWLVLRRGRWGLLGFGLLYPWLLAFTELSAVRMQEPFVLYRSYLWMSGLPAILPALTARLPLRATAGLLGSLCLVLAVAAHERLGTFSSSFALWDDAVRKNGALDRPYVERAYINRGLAALEAGKAQSARDDFERAVQLNPRSPDAHLARGTYRLRSGALQDALADFDAAVALDPAYAAPYNKRCVVKARLGRMADGLADCDQAVARDPQDAEAWINRGVVLRALRRREEAAASYERALDLNPGSASAHYNYGVILLEAGRQDSFVREHFAVACRSRIEDACEIAAKLGGTLLKR
jgi:tetratricopeptide (TPR) repeat protein